MKCMLVLLVLTTAASAKPLHEHSLSGTLSFTTLYRGTIDHSGGRFALGYDHQVDRRSSLGLRAGLAVRPDAFGSVALPFFGVRAYGWVYPSPTVAVKIGGGAELWFNSTGVGKYDEPVMIHVLAEIGPRFTLSKQWYLDVPVEFGMLGFFQNPRVFTMQVGLQLGRSW